MALKRSVQFSVKHTQPEFPFSHLSLSLPVALPLSLSRSSLFSLSLPLSLSLLVYVRVWAALLYPYWLSDTSREWWSSLKNIIQRGTTPDWAPWLSAYVRCHSHTVALNWWWEKERDGERDSYSAVHTTPVVQIWSRCRVPLKETQPRDGVGTQGPHTAACLRTVQTQHFSQLFSLRLGFCWQRIQIQKSQAC